MSDEPRPRPRRWRLPLWSLMLLILLVGIILGGSVWLRNRADRYRRMAQYYSEVGEVLEMSYTAFQARNEPSWAQGALRHNRWANRTADAYKRAAERPWISVEVEPAPAANE